MKNALALALIPALLASADRASAEDVPNPPQHEDVGDSIAMTMSSGAPTQYFFRGLLQCDRGFIGQANAELDVALYDTKALQFIIPVGFWLSVHPGDKAPHGAGPAAWYEARLSGGVALAGQAFRGDARLVVYSSPNGSFRDVYELLLKAEFRDDAIWTHGQDGAVFRGLRPTLTLAHELEGARDGLDEGTFGELRVTPRLRLIHNTSWTVEAAVPLALGVSLSDYYELPNKAGTRIVDHGLGYGSATVLFDIFPLFIARRLGLYTIQPSLELLFPTAAADMDSVDALELTARIDSSLRF